MMENLRWWLVAFIPPFVARWLIWDSPFNLGSWAPYVFGQAIGCRGKPER
jgi:hypothetical protein